MMDTRDPQATFLHLAALRGMEGPEYREMRDALLSGPEVRPLLERQQDSPEWARAVHSRILLGWLSRRALYEALLAEIDAVDLPAALKEQPGLHAVWNAFGVRAREIGEPVLPLAWEALLKHREELPGWKLLAFLRMVRAVPHVLSVEPVAAFLEAAGDETLVDAAGQTLAALPREVAQPKIAALYRKHDVIAGVAQRLLVTLASR